MVKTEKKRKSEREKVPTENEAYPSGVQFCIQNSVKKTGLYEEYESGFILFKGG